MDDIIIDVMLLIAEKINEVLYPIINEYMLNNDFIMKLVFVGMIFWIFKKTKSKKRRRR